LLFEEAGDVSIEKRGAFETGGKNSGKERMEGFLKRSNLILNGA